MGGAPSPLRADFIDVGQGDACLVTTPAGRRYLYDLGDDVSKLRAFIRQARIDSLEAVIISHADRDHFGAFPALGSIKVKQWILPSPDSADRAWLDFVHGLDSSGSDMETWHAGGIPRRWDSGVVTHVLWPPRGYQGTDNNRSLVLKVVHGAGALLLTGDAESEAENGILGTGKGMGLGCTLLKVAHHGSRTSSGLAFLAAASPTYAIISCDSSKYGHPHGETVAGLARILGDTDRIYRTDRLGSLAFEMDAYGTRRVSPPDAE